MGLSKEEKEQRKQERNKLKFEREHKLIQGIDHKFCNLHNEYFPEELPWVIATTDYFYANNKNSIDGLSTRCKRCDIIRSNINQIENRDRAYEQHKKYRKSDKYMKWGRKHGQEQKESGYMTQWRKDNPEKVNYLSSLHRNHDVSKAEEDAMLKIFNYSCAYCGMSLKNHKIKFGEKLHNDHVDDDGYNDLRNDVPACKSCNCSKHTSNLEEWYEKQDFYTGERYNKIIWWITIGYKDYIETDKPPYKIKRKKITREDNTYYWEYQLWAVNERRDMVELLDVKSKKEYLNMDLV